MSDILLLYAFTRLDALHSLLNGELLGFTLTVAFSLVVASALAPVEFKNSAPKMRKWGKGLLIVSAIGVALHALVPNRTDMAIIVGGKIALDVGRSETAKEIGNEVMGAVRATLRQAAGK